MKKYSKYSMISVVTLILAILISAVSCYSEDECLNHTYKLAGSALKCSHCGQKFNINEESPCVLKSDDGGKTYYKISFVTDTDGKIEFETDDNGNYILVTNGTDIDITAPNASVKVLGKVKKLTLKKYDSNKIDLNDCKVESIVDKNIFNYEFSYENGKLICSAFEGMNEETKKKILENYSSSFILKKNAKGTYYLLAPDDYEQNGIITLKFEAAEDFIIYTNDSTKDVKINVDNLNENSKMQFFGALRDLILIGNYEKINTLKSTLDIKGSYSGNITTTTSANG